MAYDFPRWDFLLAYPASRHPSIREAAFGRLHKGGAAFGRPPFVDTLLMDVWKLGRQGGNPTVENHMPPWHFKSHRGISFPTMGFQIPPWDIRSHHVKTPLRRPHRNIPKTPKVQSDCLFAYTRKFTCREGGRVGAVHASGFYHLHRCGVGGLQATQVRVRVVGYTVPALPDDEL